MTNYNDERQCIAVKKAMELLDQYGEWARAEREDCPDMVNLDRGMRTVFNTLLASQARVKELERPLSALRLPETSLEEALATLVDEVSLGDCSDYVKGAIEEVLHSHKQLQRSLLVTCASCGQQMVENPVLDKGYYSCPCGITAVIIIERPVCTP